MSAALDELVACADRSVRGGALDMAVLARLGPAAAALAALLRRRNGLYAFSGALHVFSDVGGVGEPGLLEWNAPDAWRDGYPWLAQDAVFFAEDAFAHQFCLHGSSVCSFEPETGDLTEVAPDLDAWARLVLDDSRYWTGWPVLEEWQSTHRPLRPGERLMPVTPFVMQGAFSVNNLRALEATSSMRFRARIARTIRDLPDGATVEFRRVVR